MAWDETKAWNTGSTQGAYYQDLLNDAEQAPQKKTLSVKK